MTPEHEGTESRSAAEVDPILRDARSDLESGHLVLAGIIGDRSWSGAARYRAAKTLARLGTAEAAQVLRSALASDQPSVLRGASLALGEIGRDRDAHALDELAGRKSGRVARTASFAASLIAYRRGSSGFEVPPVPTADLLPQRRVRGSKWSPIVVTSASQTVARTAIAALEAEVSGLDLSVTSALAIECQGAKGLFAAGSAVSSRDGARVLRTRKTIVGVFASRDRERGEYSLDLWLFGTPNEETGQIDLHAWTPSGLLALGGSGEWRGDSLEFSLRKVAAFSPLPIGIAGRWRAGEVSITQAVSAVTVPHTAKVPVRLR